MVPPTYTDVTGAPPAAEGLYRELVNCDSQETIIQLASLTTLLAEFAKDVQVQQLAIGRYVRPDFRNPPEGGATNGRPNYPFIVNRIGALIALKGVIGVERSSAKPSTTDPYHTGDLILRANSFVSGTRFDALEGDPDRLELAAEMIPTWELTNARDTAYGMAGMYRMLEFLDCPDPEVALLRTKLGIVSSEIRFAGVHLAEFLGIVFGLVSFARNLTPSQLLGDPRTCVFNSKTFLSSVNFPQEALDSFLANKALSFSALRSRLTEDKTWSEADYTSQMGSDSFRSDFLSFRESPILALDQNEYVILDLKFLTDLLYTGLFFQIFFDLPSTKREDFSSLWGRIFELSLCEMLRYFYPVDPGFF